MQKKAKNNHENLKKETKRKTAIGNMENNDGRFETYLMYPYIFITFLYTFYKSNFYTSNIFFMLFNTSSISVF